MFPDYFYNLKTAIFVSDYKCAFMDKNSFLLLSEPKDLGTDVLVLLSDIRKVFAPYMMVSELKNGAKIDYNGISAKIKANSAVINVNGKDKTIPYEVKIIDGKLWIPAGSIMKSAFNKNVLSTNEGAYNQDALAWPRHNNVVFISSEKEINIDAFMRKINVHMRGKTEGELYESFWSDEVDKIIPYSLYIPAKYDPNVPSKLIVALHGGGMGEQYIYTLSKNMMQFYAEKYNYIILLPNAGPKGGSYGSPFGNRQLCLDNPPKEGFDPKNPYELSEDELYKNHTEERCVMHALDLTLNKYNIDRSHIFLMGNSMGAIGTLYLPCIHPGLFRALVPEGGCPDLTYFDVQPLMGIPIRMIGGTDDEHGYDYIKYGFNKLREKGHTDCQLITVGGGVHQDSWAYVLEDTFKFFEKY